MINQVRDFHIAFGLPVREDPKIPSLKEEMLRMRLIQEEVVELENAVLKEDLVEIADALADILYVTLGTSLSYGIDIEAVFNAVHAANMAKLVNEEPVIRKDGKILKPEGWTPPDIAKILWPPSGPALD